MNGREQENPVTFDDLYRDLILDHYRAPRNAGALEDATVIGEGFNPSCGDEIRVSVALENGRVRAVRFQGQGCSISQSSASMLTQEASGHSVDEVQALSHAVQGMLTHEDFDLDSIDLGDLEALHGVARFPVRIKCALLAWKVLDQALAEATGGSLERDNDIQTRVVSS